MTRKNELRLPISKFTIPSIRPLLFNHWFAFEIRRIKNRGFLASYKLESWSSSFVLNLKFLVAAVAVVGMACQAWGGEAKHLNPSAGEGFVQVTEPSQYATILSAIGAAIANHYSVDVYNKKNGLLIPTKHGANPTALYLASECCRNENSLYGDVITTLVYIKRSGQPSVRVIRTDGADKSVADIVTDESGKKVLSVELFWGRANVSSSSKASFIQDSDKLYVFRN